VHALPQQERGVGVSEILEADVPGPRHGDNLRLPTKQVAGLDRRPQPAREDKALILVGEVRPTLPGRSPMRPRFVTTLRSCSVPAT
jgi:hypothetical protein